MRSIRPSEIDGEITAPPSKSVMQRAAALSLLNRGRVRITNPSFCNDSMAALGIISSMGARVRMEESGIIIEGGMDGAGGLLDCGESGLCMRMFSAVSALGKEEVVLTGREQLLARSVGNIQAPLRQLGAGCETSEGHPPVRIKGPIRGGCAVVDGREGSQFLTGLLITLPLLDEDSTLTVKNLRSRPYIRLTVRMLQDLGIQIEDRNCEVFKIRGGQKYAFEHIHVEGDWSGAAFMLVAGAIAGRVRVSGLNSFSCQGDRRIVEVLSSAGAGVNFRGNTVEVKKGKLRPFRFDASHCPDLFPPLAALACYCGGTSEIAGVDRLRGKESDRAETIVQEFGKTGAGVRVEGNSMYIQDSGITGAATHHHHDHRIAMALAVAGLGSKEGININGAECVSKSYPGFFRDLRQLGGRVDE